MGSRQWRPCGIRAVTILAGGLLASGGFVASAGAARASTTGPGEFDGTLTLPISPCLLVSGCGAGSFIGAARFTITGLDTSGLPFTAVWPDPTVIGSPLNQNLSATFGYEDQCLSGVPYSVDSSGGGALGGVFTLRGGLVVDAGRIMSGATMSGGFGWLRLGAAGVVSLAGTQISVGNAVVAQGPLLLSAEGLAAFVPTNGIGSCPDPLFNATAEVAGEELVTA